MGYLITFENISVPKYDLKITIQVGTAPFTGWNVLRFNTIGDLEIGSDSADESNLFPANFKLEAFIDYSYSNQDVLYIQQQLTTQPTYATFYRKLKWAATYQPFFYGEIDPESTSISPFERLMKLTIIHPINKLKDFANTEYIPAPGSQGYETLGSIITRMFDQAGCGSISVTREPTLDLETQLNTYAESPGENLLHCYVPNDNYFHADASSSYPNFAAILKQLCDNLGCFGAIGLNNMFYLINRKYFAATVRDITPNIISMDFDVTRKYTGYKLDLEGLYEYTYGKYITGDNNKFVNSEKQTSTKMMIICGVLPDTNPPVEHSNLKWNTGEDIWRVKKTNSAGWKSLWDVFGSDIWDLISRDRLVINLEAISIDYAINEYFRFPQIDGNKIFRAKSIKYNFIKDTCKMSLVEA